MRQEADEAKKPGRFRAAWSVLRGGAIVPDDIRWEWLQYQLKFNALLDKYAALLARDARRLTRLEEQEPAPEVEPSLSIDPSQRLAFKARIGSQRLGITANGGGKS